MAELIGQFFLSGDREREGRGKDERQRRGDVLEELLCIATAGYCR